MNKLLKLHTKLMETMDSGERKLDLNKFLMVTNEIFVYIINYNMLIFFRRLNMKKYITFILIIALVVVGGFSIAGQIKINSLRQTIQNAEGALLNGFYLKPSLDYNFNLAEKEPSKENIEALARELSFTQSLFNSIIMMNKEKINNITWQRFQNISGANKCVNYILGLSTKNSIGQTDKENLIKIREIYDVFYKNIGNDTSLIGTSIDNISSLANSYIDFITQIENIMD